jgi:PAS domain S-box-containing protein
MGKTMRIRTQFIITMFLFGIILIVASISAIVTNQKVEIASEQEKVAKNIAEGASDLSYLADDYLIYRESQQIDRWQTKYTSFSGDVSKLKTCSPEQQVLLHNIQANTQRLRDVFDSVVSGSGSSTQNPGGIIDQATLQISWSRISVQSQGLVSDASRLAQLQGDYAHQLQRANLAVILALIGVFVAYFFVNYLLVQRRTLKSIATLQSGTAVIGSGNLDFKFAVKKNDEIGDLSQAFNRMTADLKTVTASKTDLEKEIDERKKAEAEITHLATFPELNPNPVFEMDKTGDVKYSNPAAKIAFPDLSKSGIKHPFLIDWGSVTQTLTSGETPSLNREVKVGGRWYEQTMTYVPTTSNYRIYGKDITERKKAEEILRETRDYLDNLFNYANAPIIVWNPEFEITRFNHAFERLTGRTAEEVLGKKLDILFPDDSMEESMGFIRKAVIGERWEVVEIPILHLDGTVRTVLWNSATIYAPDGKTAVATIAQGQDITQRKKAEEELRQRTAELEMSNKELEAFSYSVSHDLRAPLRSMEGFSSALLEDYAPKLDDQGKQYLRYVQESSNLMAQLIDDLLKLSRVTRSDISYERVDLSDIAGKIMSELAKTESKRKVKVNIAADITAYGDRNLLRVALENLLGNAWKFCGKTASPCIEMGVVEHKGRQAYFIRDNGVGFDMAYVDKLFRPFQRLHKASEFAGTGIGLATVQRIIRRHGGEVWAESKVGEGATFYFTLS